MSPTPDTTDDRSVRGYCPLGCGETLVVTAVGDIGCAQPGCPTPSAVAELLADRETGHVATLTAAGFTLRHPLRERLGAGLEGCALHAYLGSRRGYRTLDEHGPGRYRVTQPGPNTATGVDTWHWERLDLTVQEHAKWGDV